MKFYDETKPLYLETNVSRIGLGPPCYKLGMEQYAKRDMVPDNTILRPITFVCQSMTSTEQRYSNIIREVLGILHGLKRFHHYCFAREVSITMDHKPLVAILKKDVGTLSQRIQ